MAAVTTTVLVASIIAIVILSAMYAAWVIWPQNPNVQLSVPADILGTLNVTCTKSTVSEGPITYEVIDSLLTELEVGVKSHIGYDMLVKEIVPYLPDFLNYKVALNPPLKVPGRGYESTTIDVNWGEGGTLFAKAFPGDKFTVQYGNLVKTVSGVAKLYVGSLPTTQPVNYVCPFRGSDKYTPSVSGDIISVEAPTPGCAPLLALSDYTGSKLFVVGKFSVIEYKYEQYDITLYIHVYGSQSDKHGMLYHGGQRGAFNLIELYPGTPGYSPYYKNPMYFAYYIDSDLDVERIYVDDDVIPPISIVQAMQADELSNVVLGLARERPVYQFGDEYETIMRITTEIPVLGLFKDAVITVTGLYPGDRVIVTAPTGVRYEVEAQTSTVRINLLDIFAPTDIVAAIEQGGFDLVVQPTSQHILEFLPKQMWVHVIGPNINAWIPSTVKLVQLCTLKIEGYPPGAVRIENRGDVYRVYYSTDGKTWRFYGTYPRVDVTLLEAGATLRVMDVYGNTKTYIVGEIVQEWNTRLYMLTASIHSGDKIVYLIGGTGVRIEDIPWLYIDVYGGAFEVTAYMGK